MLLKEAIADYLLHLQHEQVAPVNVRRSHRFLCRMEAQRFVLPRSRASRHHGAGVVAAGSPSRPSPLTGRNRAAERRCLITSNSKARGSQGRMGEYLCH